jgi:hypothetical protein
MPVKFSGVGLLAGLAFSVVGILIVAYAWGRLFRGPP